MANHKTKIKNSYFLKKYGNCILFDLNEDFDIYKNEITRREYKGGVGFVDVTEIKYKVKDLNIIVEYIKRIFFHMNMNIADYLTLDGIKRSKCIFYFDKKLDRDHIVVDIELDYTGKLKNVQKGEWKCGTYFPDPPYKYKKIYTLQFVYRLDGDHSCILSEVYSKLNTELSSDTKILNNGYEFPALVDIRRFKGSYLRNLKEYYDNGENITKTVLITKKRREILNTIL